MLQFDFTNVPFSDYLSIVSNIKLTPFFLFTLTEQTLTNGISQTRCSDCPVTKLPCKQYFQLTIFLS